MSTKKRVVIISDIHAGSPFGLTAPDWQVKPSKTKPCSLRRAQLQKAMWDWYVAKLNELQPINILIVNGDMIEGKSTKTEGIELITADRLVQVDMALAAITCAKAEEYLLVRGTAYHSGTGENYEDIIASKLSCNIEDEGMYSINGLRFNVVHYVAGGRSPIAFGNSIQTDMAWHNVFAADSVTNIDADIFVRSHLHKCFDVSGPRRNQRGIITPGLEGPGSRFGSRICKRPIDIGMIAFDIVSREVWTWAKHLLITKFQEPQVQIL